MGFPSCSPPPAPPLFLARARSLSPLQHMPFFSLSPPHIRRGNRYYGTVDRLDESTVAAAANGSGDGSSKEWMKMGNLLHGFVSPSLMDIKMGQRTYLHNKSNTKKKRLDLLEKMMKVDPTEVRVHIVSLRPPG